MQPLPPIKTHPSYEDEDPAPPPPPQLLFVSIRARMATGDVNDQDFVVRTMAPLPPVNSVTEPQVWSEANGESYAVGEMLTQLLDDIMIDQTFQDAMLSIDTEPVPFFSQVQSQATRSSALSSATGARKPASARVRVLGSAKRNALEQSVRASNSRGALQSEVSVHDMFFDAQVQKLAEDLLESTIANILSEADASDFNITSRQRAIGLLPKSREG